MMGKIKKAAGPKHEPTLSPALATFIKTAVEIPLQDLQAHLASLPPTWPFPRGDLYHWIDVLNHFDKILEQFNEEYGLNSGPQLKAFGCSLLVKKGTWSGDVPPTEKSLQEADAGLEGDRVLIETILDFSRLLLDNCGNRSLYNSSDRLNDILNTTSLSLLHTALRLAFKLAQRYYSRQRQGANVHSFHPGLLASYYNIELDKVQKLAFPISRAQLMIKSSKSSFSTPVSSSKGKERQGSSSARRTSTDIPNANDLVALCKEPGDSKAPASWSEWDEWGHISFFYYPSGTEERSTPPQGSPLDSTPVTPTPVRRTSAAGTHQSSRLSRVANTDDQPNAPVTPTTVKSEETKAGGGKTLDIPFSKVASMSTESILAEYLPDLPQQSKYELLNRVRAAKGLTFSSSTRRQLLAIRILALTNLAYIYPETLFLPKVLNHDSDQPKRLQVVYQLADLVHLGGNGDSKTPQHIQTLALAALEALTKHKSKVPDICTALNVNVNHGVLLYVTRKAVADMAAEVEGIDSQESQEWREALFSLLTSLPLSSARTADTLVSAGLIQIFVDILNLRTKAAERVYPKVMHYLDNFVHQVRDAFQTLANAKGLDAIADLTNFEVQTAHECVLRNEGIPAPYKTQVTDYNIPFFQQATLRSLFKFINHMMNHGGGTFDRLLRNLIDSPQLLSALERVLGHAPIFGSNIWSGAVNIMSSFIHNEPTSYNVIAEAGLSKTFLQSVMKSELQVPETLTVASPSVTQPDESMDTDSQDDSDSDDEALGLEASMQIANAVDSPGPILSVIRSLDNLAKGILPAGEAITSIPQAFGAICLNSSGLKLFRSSDALDNFFEIFESPAHVKVLKSDSNILRILGSSFDELVRHHPALKSDVMRSILTMVARVGYLCRSRAWESGIGAKLWVEDENGELQVAGGPRSLLGDLATIFDEGVQGISADKATMVNRGGLSLPSGGKLVSGVDESQTITLTTTVNHSDEDVSGMTVSDYIQATSKFLSGFFENQTLCHLFIDGGGSEFVLDLATLSSLSYDFGDSMACHELALVIHMMAESKPHLVLPSLVLRTNDAVHKLDEVSQVPPLGPAFFQRWTSRGKESNALGSEHEADPGTDLAKNLVKVHVLVEVLQEVYSQHVFPSRSPQTSVPFAQANLADLYADLVRGLGRLQGACVREEILLQNSLPDSWKEATRIKGSGMGSREADEVFDFTRYGSTADLEEDDDDTNSQDQSARATSSSDNVTQSLSEPPTVSRTRKGSVSREENQAAFKNVETLRYLLSSLPSTVTSFFHMLGKGVIHKRRLDSFQRQCASSVADALAEAVIDELNLQSGSSPDSVEDQFAYWIVTLASISQIMIENMVDRPQAQCVIMPLLAFHRQGGLKVLEDIAEVFVQQIKSAKANEKRQLASAFGGLKIILTFFAQITNSKAIIESAQTQSMPSSERDRDKPDYFLPAQFLVELRMAVVTMARRLWSAKTDFLDRTPSSIAKCLIEILRSILDGEGEKGAFKGSDNLPPFSTNEKAIFKPNREKQDTLNDRGHDKDLIKEALYRCNNSLSAAEEYCKACKEPSRIPRCPPPVYDLEVSPSRGINTPLRQASDAMAPLSTSTPNNGTPALVPEETRSLANDGGPFAMPDGTIAEESALRSTIPAPAAPPSLAPTVPSLSTGDEPGENSAATTMSIGNLIHSLEVPGTNQRPSSSSSTDARAISSATPNGSRTLPSLKQREAVRIEELDAERAGIRDGLIDRCLSILNQHFDVTFELADLIAAAVRTSKEPDFGSETVNTVVFALASLSNAEEDLPSMGKKIAAYANFLALLLQDNKMYEAVKSIIMDIFPQLLDFIKVPQLTSDAPSDVTAPWIGQILVVVEKLLSTDAEPPKIEFNQDEPGKSENLTMPLLPEKEETIPLDQKIQLFEALVEVLPRVGKDESLALSITRTLVMLTRKRDIASRLGEKRNLQRLFVMIKQLASVTNERLQSAFMIILRHVIEDEETIRQIMRSEITSSFEARSGRQINTTEYMRHMYHLILRAPDIFVEVTNEKLKISRYEPAQRPQNLVLKTEDKLKIGVSGDTTGATAGAAASTAEDMHEAGSEAAASVEVADKPAMEKSKTAEIKAPVVEHPDGVIHYLLSELLSYKDVEDKEPHRPAKSTSGGSSEEFPDVEMTNGEASRAPQDTDTSSEVSRKKEKPEFKGEEHPIYIYRCFILQCLTELLSSYNRTKVEFINFSRKADPLVMTPSKPRSGVLNYLLNSLIPVGTLEHDDSVAFKKRNNTSSWAMRVIVALCSKTGEVFKEGTNLRLRERDPIEEDDEPDLLFVRKFVLGHALSAFKEAHGSTEALDVKYAHMMSLADLFDRMLSNTPTPENSSHQTASQKLLAKLMFEKNFISALTASIADIDLTFPGSKRAAKYILRPLNKLTQTAVVLSDSISTTPGQTDEDDISSATSVSDMENEREETPDLFRHSTLGMFEQRHDDEESSSESSEDDDEEMYDGEYADGMEYEEDGLELENTGDVVSDEDEELGGPGPLEGLPGDDHMDIEVVMEGDEDDLDETDSDDEDDEDDSEDDDEDEDDVDAIGFVGEINGDDENASLHEGSADVWEDELDEEDVEGDVYDDQVEHDESQEPGSDLPDLPPFGTLLRVMGEESGDGVLDMEDSGFDNPEGFLEEEMQEEDDEDDEDDELDEDEVAFEADFDHDPRLPPSFGWGDMDEPHIHRPPPFHHHHHHHHRTVPSPWNIMPGGPIHSHRVLPIPTYRSHRSQPAPRADDGINPLLQRGDRPVTTGAGGRESEPVTFTDWVHAFDPIFGSGGRPGGARAITMDSPVTLMNAIMSAIGRDGTPGGTLPGGAAFQVHIGGPGGESRVALPGRIQQMLGLSPPTRPGPTITSTRWIQDDPSQVVTFSPVATHLRWQEEARILYNQHYFEKAQYILNAILRVLIPPAIEEEARKQEEMRKERERKAEEERKAREEAARLQKEQEEREAKEKAEREAAEAEAAAVAATAAPAEETSGEATDNIEPMEGVESTEPVASTSSTDAAAEPSTTAAAPSQQIPRVYTTIRGRQLDITDMEIDSEYLEALPEELREEVIMQQLAEQRSQAHAQGEEPTEISQEFLNALPEEIRHELLEQEAQERRRREREANRRQAAENGGPRAEEMDNANFFATLDPHLRQAVLADQPEEILAQLAPEFAAEARALTNRRMAHATDIHRLTRDRSTLDVERDRAVTKPARRQTVQMLDKAGVAALLRLMFMPQQGSSRQYLNGILHNVCENRQTRGEVVSLLLSILQDGSTDVNAVERSFAQLSLRAKQPASQKTPQQLKRTASTQNAPTSNAEMNPLMVVQQCLSALVFLTQFNAHISMFFLTPHETSSGLKSKAARKGKGKEDKATKYALNALLSLLDRKLIMDSSSCMESLSSLLSSITHPLNVLLKKDKETSEEDDKKDDKTDEPAESIVEPPVAEAATVTDASTPADTTMTEATPVEAVESTAEPTSTVDQPETVTDPAAVGSTDAKEDEPKKIEEEKPKKPRSLEPPVVPEHNLRLVVNILAARECSSKTFRETLSTINNLSKIPGAKDIFGQELVAQAQALSTSILTELIELIPNIKEAQTGTEIQGMALAKFSPSSSDQAKFLRILTALDYMFDPKRKDPSAVEAEAADGKKNPLLNLYESSAFAPLWAKLSECLSAIQQRDNMLNVATILLPLIEALMVVCKNTTLKDTPRNVREFTVMSPAPESQMESLFFNFTEEHRKILNELVRHNPKLMSGTFSLLVKNPKVLEFDNKRNYFSRRIHSRGSEQRHPQPPLQLSVRRDQVFLDSFKSLYFKSPQEMKYGKLSIRFHGEEGVDAGGVTREWFQVLSRGMFNPNYALFIPVASDRTTFHPNRLSSVNSEHLMFFKFIGRIIGKALYENRVLDCHFSRAVYKRILGKSVSIKDMETLDLDYYKSLLWMLENDITDIITENFSIETDDFGEKRIIDLIPDGHNIPVTEENKQEYVQLVVENRLVGSVHEQLENFLKGFHDIIPAELISIFNEQELELLISGLPDIDVDDWKNNAEYHNYSASSSQIQWFWRAVRSFDKEERAKLLQFVTGTSKVPLNGFKELEGMNGFSKFNIHRDYGNKDRLPSSHTCFNQLDLPEYETYEQLRQRLYTAMTTGSEYFGFA